MDMLHNGYHVGIGTDSVRDVKPGLLIQQEFKNHNTWEKSIYKHI